METGRGVEGGGGGTTMLVLSLTPAAPEVMRDRSRMRPSGRLESVNSLSTCGSRMAGNYG
jgi:hypothetical protein